ncbi:hypothetical protein Glove_31g36 [Diversispora epigaea]|uniref:AIG1-type G domain-containing protein n=1 Tax=Diversispora epigaea TaxID=1348612 RepID=A0A397JK99_9GLOM|nr:hypothetical protein Glove_31g36 [Diversispora epigaea]
MLLGNPHNNGPFETSAGMNAVTTRCQEETIVIDGTRYSIIDTPGIFDSQTSNDDVFEKISRLILRCIYGIKAILIVFELTRFSPEQRNTLIAMQNFFGNDTLRNYAIIVLSKPTKDQMINPDDIPHTWNASFIDFIQTLNNRWGISPNSDYFNSNHQIHRDQLDRIKYFIARTPGVYMTEEFRQMQACIERANYNAIFLIIFGLSIVFFFGILYPDIFVSFGLVVIRRTFGRIFGAR